MPSCSGRNLLYALMALQLISTFERQIFDFAGYMWVPILGNFLHTLIVILGIFGVYQYTSIHLVTYLVWCFIWIGWNTFLICFYLEAGSLDRKQDGFLSFDTGSFSYWLAKGPGCKPAPEPFVENEATFESFNESLPRLYKPPRPSNVNGCVLDYQYVEVIHAGIQMILSIFCLLFGIPLAHYLITVVEPKYRQAKGQAKRPLSSNGHAMYSIEYNQVNETSTTANHHAGTTQETDFYSLESNGGMNGDVRPHMTPRRVKRRSYTRSSARSAGKALKKDLHRQSGRSVRSASGALGQTKSKSINPVNRFMQEQSTVEHTRQINDSSTSNDENRVGGAGNSNIERYGQVNPGYVSSRPNSLYSQAIHNGPQSITDYEASRPPSALTSYSNFHGQRRPGMQPTNGRPPIFNQLTQESLTPFEEHKNLNQSFDEDLPPPPPPLSSSPQVGPRFSHQLPHMNGEDTDNNSSITTDTTAQMPVPLQRNMPNHRRNEYVNMPVNNHPMPSSINDQHSVSSASPDLSANHAPPLPPHNYANMPINKNPLPPPRQEEETNQQARRSYLNRPRYSAIDSDQEPLSYNDTQTLRADQKLEYPPPPKEELRSNGFPDSLDGNTNSAKPQFRQLHLDYGGGNNRTEAKAAMAEPQQATRIPTGHARRENRASLRAKHKRDMEQAQATGSKPKKPQAQLPRDEDDYGFSAGAAALPNGHAPPGHPNRDPNNDKWYLHDSMRPVGAPAHGGNCKCYRCQRKLTAI